MMFKLFSVQVWHRSGHHVALRSESKAIESPKISKITESILSFKVSLKSILNLSQFNPIKYQKRLLIVITERELIFYIPLK